MAPWSDPAGEARALALGFEWPQRRHTSANAVAALKAALQHFFASGR